MDNENETTTTTTTVAEEATTVKVRRTRRSEEASPVLTEVSQSEVLNAARAEALTNHAVEHADD